MRPREAASLITRSRDASASLALKEAGLAGDDRAGTDRVLERCRAEELRSGLPDRAQTACEVARRVCAPGDDRVRYLSGALPAADDDASTRTILVADDEPTIRTLIRTVLRHRGHRVLEASSATEIFEALDTERPDVLLLDVHLGTDDGLAIGTGLGQERQYASLKIVFMSGTAGQREATRLSELWNVPILMKPFELDELLDAVS